MNNKRGRPLKFKSPEELQKKIEEFREYAQENKVPVTVERLCVFLDCDRKTLLNYSEDDDFFPIIKSIKQEISAYHAERLLTARNPAGYIFLKKANEGYDDKHKVEISDQTTGLIDFNSPSELSQNIIIAIQEAIIQQSINNQQNEVIDYTTEDDGVEQVHHTPESEEEPGDDEDI